MTLYCTPTDLIDRYGLTELVQVAGEPGEPGETVLDTAKAARACEDAGDLVDGYLRQRYVLPLTNTPSLLKRLACAIARYDLHLGGDRQPTDQVKHERDLAVAFLRDVQAGRADLGLAPAGGVPAEAGTILSSPGIRGLDEDALSDYRELGFR